MVFLCFCLTTIRGSGVLGLYGMDNQMFLECVFYLTDEHMSASFHKHLDMVENKVFLLYKKRIECLNISDTTMLTRYVVKWNEIQTIFLMLRRINLCSIFFWLSLKKLFIYLEFLPTG